MARSIDWMLASLLIVPTVAQSQVMPGQWQTTVKITKMDMPSASPQVAQMMKAQMGTAHTTSYCVTAEQAAKGPQEMLKQNKSCKMTNFSMTGGKFTTEMTCTQQGGTLTARASGSYSPTSFSSTSTATMTGRMSMAMTTETAGHRIGPCTGK